MTEPTNEPGGDFLSKVQGALEQSVGKITDALATNLRAGDIAKVIQEIDDKATTIVKSFGQGRENIVNLKSAMADAASEVERMGGEFQNIVDIQKDVAEALGRNLILTSLAGQAASLAGTGNLSLNQALARSSGQIINPNVELLFNGPTIRNFRFSFKMTPRNRDEANQIRAIIRSLKKHMSPRDNAANENIFLSAPNIFELRYKKGKGNNEYLNRFKRCVLENMSVNYTGENVYATYDDGAPISTIMDLTFKELEPIYASDYNTGEGQIGVGY